MRRMVVMAALFVTALCHAGERRVFRGTLGGKAILMELELRNHAWQGRYCEERRGVDIPLKGPADQLEEPAPTEPDVADPVSAATWCGVLSEKGYAGQRSGKHKQAFSLREIARYDPERVKPGAVQAVTEAIAPGVGMDLDSSIELSMKTAPYDYLKVAPHLRRGKEIHYGTVALSWFKETRTGIAYPRISIHPDAKVMHSVNQLLAQRHFRLVLSALACAATVYDSEPSPAAGGFGGFEEESIQVDCFTEHLLCLVESGSTYCGGAHPDNHYEPFALDLHRGEYLDWNRMFKDASVDPETGELRWKQALRARLPKAGTPGHADPAGCRETLEQYLTPSLTQDKRLVLCVSSVPHVLGCCLGVQEELALKDYEDLLSGEGRRYLGLSRK